MCLLQVVPKSNLSEHQKLSKIATLRLAIHYISALSATLKSTGAQIQPVKSVAGVGDRRGRRRGRGGRKRKLHDSLGAQRPSALSSAPGVARENSPGDNRGPISCVSSSSSTLDAAVRRQVSAAFVAVSLNPDDAGFSPGTDSSADGFSLVDHASAASYGYPGRYFRQGSGTTCQESVSPGSNQGGYSCSGSQGGYSSSRGSRGEDRFSSDACLERSPRSDSLSPHSRFRGGGERGVGEDAGVYGVVGCVDSLSGANCFTGERFSVANTFCVL